MPEHPTSASAGKRWKSSGSEPTREDEQRRRMSSGQPQLRAQQRADVDLAERGLLVDLAGAAARGVPAAPGRAGDPDPGRRAAARSSDRRLARAGSSSRSSRVCRRLTTELGRRRRPRTRAAAGLHPHLGRCGRARPAASGGCGRNPRRPTPPRASASGTADQVDAVGGVQPGVVALRLDVGDVGAVDEPGHAAELDGDLLVARAGAARGAAVDDPAHRLGEPLGSRTGLST